MEGDLGQSTVLFEKVVPICVSHADREDRHASINVLLSMESRSPHNTKVLHIRLTEEDDPFFLYSLDIGEEDFQSLKSEQHILIDFNTFPTKMIDLLRLCIDDKGDGPQGYQASLTCKVGLPAALSVIETNHFKHLCHLSLNVREGNDSAIKKYLAERLRDLKAANGSLGTSLHHTQENLSSKLASAEEQLAMHVHQHEKDVELLQQLKLDHSREISALKENALAQQTDLHRRHEEEKRELTNAYESKLDSLKDDLGASEIANRELTDAKFTLESRVRDCEAQIHNLEQRCAVQKDEISTLKEENKSLDTAKYELEKSHNRTLIKLSAIEQQVRDKDEINNKMSAMLDGATRQKEVLEESVKVHQNNASRLEEKVTMASQEIHKGNEIIQKLSSELRTAKAKLKAKNHQLEQMQEGINNSKVEMEKRDGEIATLKQKVEIEKGAQAQLKTQCETVSTKLEEAQKLIQTNQNVINFLNKELNEAQMGQRIPFSSSSHTFRPNSSHSHSHSHMQTPSVHSGSTHGSIATKPINTPFLPSYSATPMTFKGTSNSNMGGGNNPNIATPTPLQQVRSTDLNIGKPSSTPMSKVSTPQVVYKPASLKSSSSNFAKERSEIVAMLTKETS